VAERRPPGFNVDLGFYDSDEVLSIPRKIRAAAVGVWTLCGSYAANKLTDGYVSAEALRDRGCTPAIRAALMSTTPQPLWEAAPDLGDVGAIRFTRWAKWQRTSGEVKAYRDADAERKRKAREARKAAETSDDSEMSGRTSAGRSSDVRADSGTPKTETETKTKKENSGYVPESASLSTAGDAIAATPGADLVRELIPTSIPAAERTMLRIKASALLREGSTREDVTNGLRLYLTKPHLGAGALPALVSESVRSRAAPTVNGHDAKVGDYLAFANQPTQREIES
jgi:hypothetical protein